MNEATAGFLADPIVWYTLALVIFLSAFVRYARRPLLGWLDGEIAKIRIELEQARKLRAEAEAVLADYRHRQQEAVHEAEAIIAHAREEADRLRRTEEQNLREMLQRHEQQALERIRLSESEAVAEVRAVVIAQAMVAARAALAAQLDTATAERLVDQAITEVPSLTAAKAKAA